MTLHGIDVSAYQADLNFSAVDMGFAIVKATGGPGYVNLHMAGQLAAAGKAGARLGAYHFARDGWTGTTAREEAEHFLKHAPADVLPVLDWEADNVWDVAWATEWLRIVEERLDVKPLIYMNLSNATAYDWSEVARGGYRLWLAMYGNDQAVHGYQTLARPTVQHWGAPALWQYTQRGRLPGYGADLDLNISYEDVWVGAASTGPEELIPGVTGIHKP